MQVSVHVRRHASKGCAVCSGVQEGAGCRVQLHVLQPARADDGVACRALPWTGGARRKRLFAVLAYCTCATEPLLRPGVPRQVLVCTTHWLVAARLGVAAKVLVGRAPILGALESVLSACKVESSDTHKVAILAGWPWDLHYLGLAPLNVNLAQS